MPRNAAQPNNRLATAARKTSTETIPFSMEGPRTDGFSERGGSAPATSASWAKIRNAMIHLSTGLSSVFLRAAQAPSSSTPSPITPPTAPTVNPAKTIRLATGPVGSSPRTPQRAASTAEMAKLYPDADRDQMQAADEAEAMRRSGTA